MPCVRTVPVLATILTGLALAATTEPTRADTLLVERVSRPAAMPLPMRGQTQATVRASFGAPLETLPAVGGDRPQHPPITRWVYPEFTVHFEHDRVIHTVLRRSSPHEQGPKPAE